MSAHSDTPRDFVNTNVIVKVDTNQHTCPVGMISSSNSHRILCPIFYPSSQKTSIETEPAHPYMTQKSGSEPRVFANPPPCSARPISGELARVGAVSPITGGTSQWHSMFLVAIWPPPATGAWWGSWFLGGAAHMMMRSSNRRRTAERTFLACPNIGNAPVWAAGYVRGSTA